MSGDAYLARETGRACSLGSLRNDGLVRSGLIVDDPDDCDDNYLAELAAIQYPGSGGRGAEGGGGS